MSPPTVCAMPMKAGSRASEQSGVQTCAVSHAGAGLGTFSAAPDEPERKKRHSSASILPCPCMILMQTQKEKSSLCASKSERQMFS